MPTRRNLKSKDSPMMNAVFPYRQLFSFACRNKLHSDLDQLIAKRADPFWDVVPRRGRSCICRAIDLLAHQATPDADTPAFERIGIDISDLLRNGRKRVPPK
jgi:hypothetical protein